MKMESTEIEASSVDCGGTTAIFRSAADMPNTEQESSFIDGEAGNETGNNGNGATEGSNTAPLFSFDEDGDILPRERPFTPNNSVESECESTSAPPSLGPSDNSVLVNQDLRDHSRVVSKEIQIIENGSTPSTPKPSSSGRRRKMGVMKSSSSTSSIDGANPQAAPVGGDVVTTPGGTSTNPQVSIVLEQPSTSVPKIDFHAPSIEVVDDYLEGHLDEDSQLRDLYSSLLGDPGFVGGQLRSPSRSCVSLLSATPQDTAPKRQRVPFSTVVFTERKPSTGDALIQSLGLSADGADTIQDIASKNQGAARERLQLAEGGGPVEAVGLTSHCESCGVSPEDCLKKLGLQTDRERLLSPSPKSEKLWQLFQQIQAGFARPIRSRRPSGSEPELDIVRPDEDRPGVTVPTKSRSLEASPLHSPLNDMRKPMLNTV
ncbi:uncharacterized protein LOC135208668 [Macrobrachium nipponense]|uniref:uncharacterized protein LOC135208668 n=1 Tax=Macrobrachium nipponense TaxID=159736 RepID=UPI0030C7F848